ncbi:MAG: dUTP diphosphatase [Oscillospiraceae bacterium]
MLRKLKVKILNEKINIPEKATRGSACFDLQASINEPIIINPGNIIKVPTGIAIGINNKKYAAFVFGRSGLGVNHGITLSNSVGVIDSDYSGEICVGLCNVSNNPYTINPLDRIAQLCVMPVFCGSIITTQSLKTTTRGEKGFGSSGK